MNPLFRYRVRIWDLILLRECQLRQAAMEEWWGVIARESDKDGFVGE
jgi:hypothetical protein